MDRSIAETKDIISNLENDFILLKERFDRGKLETDSYLEKLCRDYEESQSLFREKFENLQVRLNKSTRILDDLVDTRFKVRERKMQEIKDLEDMISVTKLNIQKVHEHTDLVLQRIEKQIETKLMSVLIS